jgi:hypothetical protein
MKTHKAHLEAMWQLYRPDISVMTKNLPSMADSLSAACNALASDCSVERCDELTNRLKAAQTSLTHLRKALISEKGGVQRCGTG